MISRIQRTLLLGSSVAALAVLSSWQNVNAACIASPSPAFICSGTVTTSQNLVAQYDTNVWITSGFVLNNPLGEGFYVGGRGNISFNDFQTVGPHSVISAARGSSALAVFNAGHGSDSGNVSITTYGTLLGGTYGISASNISVGDLIIRTGDGSITGTAIAGISASIGENAADLQISTASGTIFGGEYGIRARNFATGDLRITTGGKVTGQTNSGILAANGMTSGDLTVYSGDGGVLGGQEGINASQAGTGDMTLVTGRGNVIGNGTYGVYAHSSYAGSNNLSITTGSGAVLGAKEGIRAIQEGHGIFRITVGGLVSNLARDDAGEAITILNGAPLISNLAAGNITGRITAAAGQFDDTFDNAGQWISNGTSDFGGGINKIFNSGTVRTANTPHLSEKTTFENATMFYNDVGGIITLSDEATHDGTMPNDTLLINGNYSGGGILAVDAYLGGRGSRADILSVAGSVTGVTKLRVNNTNRGTGEKNDGITVVEYRDNAADGAFVLENGPITTGLFSYNLERDQANKVFKLVSTGISSRAFELNALTSGSNAMWGSTSGTVVNRVTDIRQFGLAAADQSLSLSESDSQNINYEAGPWVKLVGNPSLDWASPNSGYKLETRGLMVGSDYIVDDSFAVGATSGYVTARQNFRSGSNASYEGVSSGIYATYLKGGFHIDTELRANLLHVDYTMLENPTTHPDVMSFGGSMDAGYRIELPHGFYAEPTAHLDYLDTTVRHGEISGTAFSAVGKSLRGGIGLNFGGEVEIGENLLFRPKFSSKLWNEFEGNNTAEFAEVTVASKSPKTFGEIGLNLETVNTETGWTGQLTGQALFTGNTTSFGGSFGLSKNF